MRRCTHAHALVLVSCLFLELQNLVSPSLIKHKSVVRSFAKNRRHWPSKQRENNLPLTHNDMIKHEKGRTLLSCKVNVLNSLNIKQIGIIGTMRLAGTIDRAMHSLINNGKTVYGLPMRNKYLSYK